MSEQTTTTTTTEAANPAPAVDASATLYPNEGKPVVTEAPAAPSGEWKEYVADATKSEAENAAAKAEHDKTKPADKSAELNLDAVPEDGKYQLTMPEGVTLDQALLDKLAPDFKAAGLTHKQAQALADKYIEQQRADGQAQVEAWQKMTSDWVNEAKADAEIGGPKWDATVKAATGVVAKFGNEKFSEFLNSSGAGNHPEMIRLMAKVGAVIGEDRPAISETPNAAKPLDTSAVLYPNDKPKGK